MNEQKEQIQSSTERPPSNYLAWAIITTILCCLPFGIVSIVYAAQVNSKWQSGDYEGAKAASKNAKVWAWVAFAVGIATIIIWTILTALGIIAGLGVSSLDIFNV